MRSFDAESRLCWREETSATLCCKQDDTFEDLCTETVLPALPAKKEKPESTADFEAGVGTIKFEPNFQVVMCDHNLTFARLARA